MTPAARIAAAADLLEQVLQGAPAERVLTTWARQNRFAGSKDRAAIRDHVFEALRCCRSYAALGGARTGRGLMIGALRAQGQDPATFFTGEGYAPAPLSTAEQTPTGPLDGLPDPVRLDCPDWLAADLQASLGADFAPVMQILRRRAPVFLRVNLARASRELAIKALADEGIATQPHPYINTALEVTEKPRRIHLSMAYGDGFVELQDAASQAVVAMLPLSPGMRVLDYCAGGGGKALAMAAVEKVQVFAHDIDAGRMRDLPVRAARAGASIPVLDREGLRAAGRFDLVLADAPCSGSGAWRRTPQAKWDLTPERLDQLCAIQAEILDETRAHVAPGGHLAYATCSLLERENEHAIKGFLDRHQGWKCQKQRRFSPLDGGDGFFAALLTRKTQND